MKLTFKISVLSDYHIGAGYGKGIIDSAILRDRSGLPIIRGSTLSGLLRQGVWDLLSLDLLKSHRSCKQSGNSDISYCTGADEKALCPICRILGTPEYPKKWNISSAKIENPSVAKKDKIIWRNKVNPRTRTSEAKKLFNEETSGGNIGFVFEVSNESDDLQTLEEAAFITAAFRMIRNMGASRRRGKGLCKIHLVDGKKEEELLDMFKTKWLENGELKLSEKNTPGETTGVVSLTKKSFNVILLTKEPLLIANRSESGNRFQTIDHIPGYALLGALAWKSANRWKLDDENIYEKFIKLFRRGGIKISPLYPCWKHDGDIYPSVPSPHDFLTCKLHPGFEKDNGHGAKGYAGEENEPKKCDKCLEKGYDTPLKPLNKQVTLYQCPKDIETVNVARREEMHITINPKTGKTETGELFSYTVIESGQYFMGTIDIDNWGDFNHLLGIKTQKDEEDILFELRIGKASSRGYGLTEIWFKEENNDKTFLGKEIKERVKDLTKPITMTLLTDAILVDKWGRFYNTLDEEILKNWLGLDVEVVNRYVKSKNIDGFNTYLGLPRWRDYAISAGSSIGFKVKNQLNNIDELLKILGKLEKEGLGLRKDEGFGKIAFNHPVYNKNEGVSVRIHLPNSMRLQKGDDKVKNFEAWWRNYLMEKLNKKDFANKEWMAVSRWLRQESINPKIEITGLLSNFCIPEKIEKLIDEKKVSRNKEKFMDDKGKRGFESLSESLKELSDRINTENENIRPHLKVISIEILDDFIEGLTEVEK